MRHIVFGSNQRHRRRTLCKNSAAVETLSWNARRIVCEERPVGGRNSGTNARERRRRAGKPCRCRRIGENTGPQQVAEIADAAANHSDCRSIETADVVLAGSRPVVLTSIVCVRKPCARADVKTRRCDTGLNTKCLLESGILCGTRGESIGFEPGAIENVEETCREIVVGDRSGTVPDRARPLRLREGTCEARRMSRGEIINRIKREIAERIRYALLLKSVGSSPKQSLESMAAAEGIPRRFVCGFGRPPAVVGREERSAAEREARDVVRGIVSD